MVIFYKNISEILRPDISVLTNLKDSKFFTTKERMKLAVARVFQEQFVERFGNGVQLNERISLF